MKKCIMFIYILLCFYNASSQNFQDSLIVAKLDIVQAENIITFRPTVENKGGYHYPLDYLLLIKIKDENKNLSVKQQKGRFTLAPYQVLSLTETSHNQQAKQKITAILFIRNEVENRLITKDSIEIQTKELIPINESELTVMKGIVVDDSKTKVGRDFYDLFYTYYNQYHTKFDFVVQISELPYRGLSSIIQVKAEQDIITEFFTNPDEDYLKQQVIDTFRKLGVYADRRGKLKNEFTY